ncbi:hypothetical protein ABZW30_08035 [Kitasatospora sp. NPDC004669]|uniref:hypothetical protein n=1 Tax=Kitasatospora sp. NPDC004669 TaxID=3154555 RepID=UPI0033BF8330
MRVPQGDMDPNSYDASPQSTPDGTIYQYPDFTPTGPAPAAGRQVIRAVPHPAPLDARGIPIICSQCGAGRDWLLLNFGRQVFVRCRCSHEWPEPDLDLEFFESSFGGPERAWEDFDQAVTGLGFDGTLAGTYWD